VQFGIDCLDGGVACTESEISRSYSVSDASLTSTSWPVNWNNGLMRIEGTSISHAGVYTFTVTVSATEVSSGWVIGSEAYSLSITVEYAAADVYTISKESIASSQTYEVGASAISVQYGLNCFDELENAACASGDVSYAYAISSTAGPITFSTGLLSIWTDDYAQIGTHTSHPHPQSLGDRHRHRLLPQTYSLSLTRRLHPRPLLLPSPLPPPPPPPPTT